MLFVAIFILTTGLLGAVALVIAVRWLLKEEMMEAGECQSITCILETQRRQKRLWRALTAWLAAKPQRSIHWRQKEASFVTPWGSLQTHQEPISSGRSLNPARSICTQPRNRPRHFLWSAGVGADASASAMSAARPVADCPTW